MKEITVPAALGELGRVTDFINEELEAQGCPLKAQMQIDIAVEEIYVNIAHYAYHPGVGEATVRCATRCRWKSSSWTAGRPITRWQRRTRTLRSPPKSGRLAAWGSTW